MKVTYLQALPCRVGKQVSVYDLVEGEIAATQYDLWFYKLEGGVIYRIIPRMVKHAYSKWHVSIYNDRKGTNAHVYPTNLVIVEDIDES